MNTSKLHQSESGNASSPSPDTKHPCSVLVDLKSLDIVDGHDKTESDHGTDNANPNLNRSLAAYRDIHDHVGARVANQHENDGGISVETVEENGFVSNNGDELKACKKTAGDSANEVHRDSDPVTANPVVVPFAWYSVLAEKSVSPLL